MKSGFAPAWVPPTEKLNGRWQMTVKGMAAHNWKKPLRDRKSTRLNSSHQIISYAVFCLKKKNESKAVSREITNRAAINKKLILSAKDLGLHCSLRASPCRANATHVHRIYATRHRLNGSH